MLTLVRDAGRQPSDVPVHVCVALLASQRQQVGPFWAEDFLHGERDSVDDEHEAAERGFVQVPGNVLDVCLRGDEGFAGDGGPPVQECDMRVVFVDRLVLVVMVSVQVRTDEAGAGPGPGGVGIEIHGQSLIARRRSKGPAVTQSSHRRGAGR